ncbi:MAG: phosphoglucosamine mutase [Rhodothermales bacterium]|nr:phosphoglucosamine mutase [Rhodothermales bacterium]
MNHTLVESISGIRGIVGRGFDPDVIQRYTAAFARMLAEKADGELVSVVVGRDGRASGPVCADLVCSILRASGIDVLDAGLASTPTVETAVLDHGAAGGIILSASHNPAEWNALKLLNDRGEFLSPEVADRLINRARAGDAAWASWDALGSSRSIDALPAHIEHITSLPEIRPAAIASRDFRIVVDGINSVGGIAIPALLEAIGVRTEQIVRVNCEPDGRFAHPAEPLPAHLTETVEIVRREGADLGIVVDPDADRLALIRDGGVYVSEELTQVIAADFWWRHRSGPFVTNLSSSRAIEDVAERHGESVFRSAVGEINVVEEMKRRGAALGGEGNGGVIVPDLHYGRDALAGTAMILQHLVDTDASLSEIIETLPAYEIVKLKTDIGDSDPEAMLSRLADRYADERISLVDGVKIDLEEGWVHMRRSNTEPIIRVYAEAATRRSATALGERFMAELTA